MLLAGKAIVLQTHKYGDQAMIARLFTRQRGLLSFLVKGVYNRRSHKVAMLQPMNLVQLSFRMRDNVGLQLVNDLKVGLAYRQIPFDPVRLAQLSLMAELMNKTLKELEPDEQLFDFLENQLCFLDESETALAGFHLYFLLEFTRFMGIGPGQSYTEQRCYFSPRNGDFLPDFSAESWNKNLSETLFRLMSTPRTSLHAFKSNRSERNELLEKLLEYYRIHFPSITEFKSPAVLNTLFNT